MKKVLALFLAIMMLFGTLSVGASALDLESISDERKAAGKLTDNQVILSFDLNGGTIKGGVRVYTPAYYDTNGNKVAGSFSWSESYLENMYYMIPESIGEQEPGDEVALPNVTPPSGYVFNGWYCTYTNSTHPGNRSFKIPDHTGGKVLQFIADYAPDTPEEDEMAGVFNILVKVFGTIIGLLFLSDKEEGAVEAGMQLMSNLLGSLFA